MHENAFTFNLGRLNCIRMSLWQILITRFAFIFSSRHFCYAVKPHAVFLPLRFNVVSVAGILIYEI
jgi:hypothetical protein